MTNRRKTRRGGFTLVEIMVVVVIIGVLAGFLVVNFMQSAHDAKVKSTRAQFANVGTPLSLYKLETGKYPASLQELIPKYLKEMPRDGWNRDLQYQRDPQVTQGYRLWSFGADGAQGGEGEFVDLSNLDVVPQTAP